MVVHIVYAYEQSSTCIEWNCYDQMHLCSWKNKFLNIKVPFGFNTSLKLRWHLLWRHALCICLQYLFPLPGCAQTHRLCKAAEPHSWPGLCYCTWINIINKQHVVQVFMGEKLLQYNRPGRALHWNKHKSILTHFLAAREKMTKLFFSHWLLLTQILLPRTQTALVAFL